MRISAASPRPPAVTHSAPASLPPERGRVGHLVSRFEQAALPSPDSLEITPRMARLSGARTAMVKVVPQVFITNYFGARQLQTLKAAHIDAILNCTSELPEAHPGEFHYLKLDGLNDDVQINLKPFMRQALPWIHDQVSQGQRVLVHCAGGDSRSGAILVAYIMWDQHISFDDALQKVHAVRPEIVPNPGFRRQLRDFEWTGFDLHAR